ncbi:MAG: hypothetical protein JJ939_12535 [Alphaproteobacteria bacterium]|nr:hypothetical protein [Alphaproteobacteria bacterium]MBO6629240.1 hypothetical protein [Alphaproteobacteria bacterium]
MRSDIHTLFDLGLFSIDPQNCHARFSIEARRAGYEKWEGKVLSNLDPKSKTLLEGRCMRFQEL